MGLVINAAERFKPARGGDLSIVPAQVGNVSDWTLESAMSALDLLEQGDFSQAAALADAMGRDARIVSPLGTRIRALTARSEPFTVEAGGGHAQRAGSIAKRVDGVWWDIFPERVIKPVFRDTIMLGASVAKVEFKTLPSGILPVVHPLPLHNLRFDAYLDRWSYLTTTGPVPVTPGDGWILHLPDGARSWMMGAVRALTLPFIFGGYSERDWARFNEKHGLGILAIEEPASASTDPAGTNRFYSQLRNLGREGLLRLPQGRGNPPEGWKAAFLNPGKGTGDTFQDNLARQDTLKQVVLLGRDAATADKSLGGDGEAAVERVRGEYLASDAEPLATTLREQLLMQWLRLDVPNWDDALAPWPKWSVRSRVDLAARASTLATLAPVLSTLTDAGVDTEPLLAEFQLTKRADLDGDAKAEFYQYDLELGVVTINEARARKGLPPLPDGDRTIPEATAAAAPPPPPEVPDADPNAADQQPAADA